MRSRCRQLSRCLRPPPPPLLHPLPPPPPRRRPRPPSTLFPPPPRPRPFRPRPTLPSPRAHFLWWCRTRRSAGPSATRTPVAAAAIAPAASHWSTLLPPRALPLRQQRERPRQQRQRAQLQQAAWLLPRPLRCRWPAPSSCCSLAELPPPPGPRQSPSRVPGRPHRRPCRPHRRQRTSRPRSFTRTFISTTHRQRKACCEKISLRLFPSILFYLLFVCVVALTQQSTSFSPADNSSLPETAGVLSHSNHLRRSALAAAPR